jgi:hypothetical protein
MKRPVILLISACFCFLHAFSQCEKPVLFTSYKARIISNGTTGNTAVVKTTIEIRKGIILFTNTINSHEAGEKYMITGTPVCNWSGYLQNGKTKYEANSIQPDSPTPVKCIVEIAGTAGNIKINITNTNTPTVIYQYEVASYVFK